MIFQVDRKQRTVTAVIEQPAQEAYAYLANKISNKLRTNGVNLPYSLASDIVACYNLRERFPRPLTATAKCSPMDEWDVEFGMRLAQHRVLTKYWRKMSSISLAMYRGIVPTLKQALVDSFEIAVSKTFDEDNRATQCVKEHFLPF